MALKTVLHVIDTTGPGGAETVFIELASRLDAARYRSIALIRGPGWVEASLQARGIPIFTLDCKGSFNVRYLRELITLIRRERVDVIQSHLLGSNVYCALAGLLTGRRVVATFHGGVDIHTTERFLAAKLGLIRFGARYVVSVSNALTQELLQRASMPRNKIRVIYNGIDTAAFQQAKNTQLRDQFALPADSTVIGALGNIRPAKDYPNLLDAIAQIADEFPQLQVTIAGEGSGRLMQSLLEQRRTLGLDARVHFVGFVSDPAHYLGNLDFFVLSSNSEGFSIATIQAMATGLPVIATRSGGPEEIITDGIDGLLVAKSASNALADGLRRALRDARLRHDIAANAANTVRKRFDIAQMVNGYCALYEA